VPTLLYLEKENQNPLDVFKLNYSWLDHKEFITLVSSNWKKFDCSFGELAMFQFDDNLRSVKKVVVKWAMKIAIEVRRN